ncbi:MAG: hypothetical protein CMO20_02275 [Thermoplasmata archaeon]|nr:hypothetical protein [Thermoplasmata archaeon]
MSITLANLTEAFPNFSQPLTKQIIDWYSNHPTKEISPSDIWTAPFHKEVVEAGVEEYQLADFLDMSPDDGVNFKTFFHEIDSENYSLDYSEEETEFHSYALGSNQFETLAYEDDDDIFIWRDFSHLLEVICPVCRAIEYKEYSAEAEAFLDVHYKMHVKESEWVPKGCE